MKTGRIILAGTIGAGKTTVADYLSRETNRIVWREPVDTNPILKTYYDDPADNAYLLQTFFLTDRFQSMMNAKPGDILDRSLDESYLFAEVNHKEGNMTEAELSIYRQIYRDMYHAVEKTNDLSKDLLVYLDIDYDHVIERVKKRDRSYEQFTGDKKKDAALKRHYQLLIEGYQELYKRYDRGQKIRIDMNNVDLVADVDTREKVIGDILKKLEDIATKSEPIKK